MHFTLSLIKLIDTHLIIIVTKNTIIRYNSNILPCPAAYKSLAMKTSQLIYLVFYKGFTLRLTECFHNRKALFDIQRRIITFSEELCFIIDCIKRVIPSIDAANKKSIKLHEKLGFRHSGTIKPAGFKFNKWLDLSFYQLDLRGPKVPIED